MLYRSISRILAICLAAFVLAITTLARDYQSLVGKWNMTSETDNEPVQWVLVLKDTDGKLAAFLATDSGEQAAKDFHYADGVLKFEAPYEGEYYDIELKVSGDKLDGTWSGGGNSGRTIGIKAVTP